MSAQGNGGGQGGGSLRPGGGSLGPSAGTSPAVGSIVAGRYLVHRLLGEGGMGAVYEAEHVQLKKRVALKVLHSHMSQKPEVLARFEREAVAAARIRHPSVVTAIDFGRLGGDSFYLALEYVSGKSLSELLDAEKTLAPERAAGIAYQLAGALAAAHAEGIVHRDLKPDNIMLVDIEGEDYVKVLDFGIAMMRLDELGDGAERITRAGLVFGTPDYMSPEQAQGLAVDERTDLYALGMILYEMLTGEAAFHSEEVVAILTAQMTDPPPPLPESVPPSLGAVVMRLLEKDPNLRPQTAAELEEQLAEAILLMGGMLPAPRTLTSTRYNRPGSMAGRQKDSVASLRSLSMRPVAVGGARVPLFLPVVLLVAGLAVGGYFAVASRASASRTAASALASAPAPAPDYTEQARAGDRVALGELRRQVENDRLRLTELEGTLSRDPAAPVPVAGELGSERTRAAAQLRASLATRFLALGRGYSEIRHYSAVIGAYRDAVDLDPHLGDDATLLVDMRAALEQRDVADEGFTTALSFLGSHGADMIYDIVRTGRGQPGMTAVVARAMRLVASPELRKVASEPLRIALELDDAKVCAEYKQLLPRAILHADERSSVKLREVGRKTGCGRQARGDCFPCLRDDPTSLETAIRHAGERKQPGFLGTKHPAPGTAAD